MELYKNTRKIRQGSAKSSYIGKKTFECQCRIWGNGIEKGTEMKYGKKNKRYVGYVRI